ncbi:type VII secretion integral membrane protein EccD [Amycolatopsis sp. H20-H5]|uniref:type VII secretion integral membrane protein EccD n=1 Tax=Amycolatopsis sp. H20-H5 TaxID=3046309 RepID=UPI002DB5BE72|nr:type VII secretion integral membrane protein EccD [Amycolatopsis sp. H20-H5]MEC3975218.1 type VII secretion integral membrane protein EccD [Amycolatopsis sp. H20-H5]
MTSAQAAEMSRITVFGPSGKVDLAVPSSTTISNLLPMLVHHTVDATRADPGAFGDSSSSADGNGPSPAGPLDSAVPVPGDAGSWVLQRLGEDPLDPDGTPETLDLLEGEQLYLRPAGNPLPELDFDDIADGMATAVGWQSNHWQPWHGKVLFISLALAALVTVFTVLFTNSSGVAATIGSGVLAGLFAAASVSAGRWLDDYFLAALPGVAACCFAATAGLIGVAGPAHALELNTPQVLVAAVCATAAAGLLLGARYSVAGHLPIVPFGVVAAGGITIMISAWLHAGMELTPAQTAATMSTAFFLLMIYAPKLAIRAARLRGPQLPKTGADLKIDIEPAPAKDIVERTGFADRYLNVLVMVSALTYLVSFPFMLDLPDWVGLVLPMMFTFGVLLRARAFIGVAQRLAVTVSGTAGIMYIAIDLTGEGASVSLQWAVLVLLLCTVPPLVLAATRASTRRMLPIWGHIGNISDTLTALAVLPLLLQALGVYAWARGLAG